MTSVANYNAGKENATGTSSNTKGGALQFDAYKALKIKTVKVVADETGARIIELVNNRRNLATNALRSTSTFRLVKITCCASPTVKN